MGLSLIALAVFSACSDEVENGGLRPGKGDHSLSFAVSTPGWQAFTKADGTHEASAPATQELEPVEMEGKVNGKSVYLTAEVAEGFPCDRQPMTRGTQVTDANKTNDGIMQTFAVSVYTDKTGRPDFMYSVPTTKGSPENGSYYWYPEEKFYWPGVRTLNFYAWYPHTANAEGLTVSGADQNGAPTLHYIVPDDVKKQMDVMTAVAADQSEQEAISLTFNHALAAVKFVAGSDLPNCVVKSIKLHGLQFEGTYDVGASTWAEVKPTKKNFTVTWGYNAVEGTEGSPVTAEDETFFMMPQTLDGASVEVTFKDTDNSEFTVGAALTGTWEKGNTYTYRISHNFVYLGVSNEKFVAYVDEDTDITDQLAFYIMAGASTAGTMGTISGAPAGVTVSPATFGSGAKIPVKVTWPKNVADFDITLTMDGKTKAVSMARKAPTVDDAFYVYSVPETTSQPFTDGTTEGVIVELQNASESDWLAMTPSPTFSKDATYQAIYDNKSQGDIYLQTLSIPAQNRIASLLACKEDMSKNVMYCVEQKAITADFGFKNCERNISREAEKWNIVLSGGRLKEDVTNLKAKVVISSSVPDAQISALGRDLTYGEPAMIAVDKNTHTGFGSYVKMRWDNQTETTANNGTRVVNVQLSDSKSGTWYDIDSKGTMADWMTWGPGNDYVFANDKSYQCPTSGAGNAYNYAVKPVFSSHFSVHVNHPLFGLNAHRWQCVSRGNRQKNNYDPAWRFYQGNNSGDTGVHGLRHRKGGGLITIDSRYNNYTSFANSTLYWNARGYNPGTNEKTGCYYIEMTQSLASSYPSEKDATWYSDRSWRFTVPIIYISRPDNSTPITGQSVNE